jgi:hypothetical protein
MGKPPKESLPHNNSQWSIRKSTLCVRVQILKSYVFLKISNVFFIYYFRTTFLNCFLPF